VASPLSPAFPLTYAARGTGVVRLQLHVKQGEPLTGVEAVRLRHGSRTLEAPARLSDAPGGQLVTAEVPQAPLTEGAWQLQVRTLEGSSWQDAQAYLLVPADGPVSLLLGHPAARGLITPHRKPLRQRAAHVVGRASDALLAPLGPRRARSARSWLRRTGRRVLS